MAKRHTAQFDTGLQIVTLNPVPSASAATFGAYVAAVLPAAGTAATLFAFLAGNWTPAGTSGETINLSYQVTYSDGTTATFGPPGVAGNASLQSLGGNTFVQLAKSGTWITGVQVQAKSSIAASTAVPSTQLLLLPVG